MNVLTNKPSTISVKIRRQDRPDSPAYWQTFEMPYKLNMNITSVLRAIAAQPVTVEGQATTPPVYDVACLEEICGSCTMVINGKARQACSALVDPILAQRPGT